MNSILIIVDIQNGFTRYEQTQVLAKKIIALTNSGIFDKIIATRFLNREGSQYTKFMNWHRLIESPDIDLVEGIKADKVLDKWIYTCVDDSFMNLLKELNNGEMPTHVFVCGADTDCCVLKTSVDLFEKGIMPLVLTQYCNSNGGPKAHEAGLLAMSRLLGKQSIVDEEIESKETITNIIKEKQY